MITVIATGFDGGRKRHRRAHREATGVMDTAARAAPPRERDFLEELAAPARRGRRARRRRRPATSERAAARGGRAPRVERSVGEPAPVKRPTTYDADDLEIPSFLRRK